MHIWLVESSMVIVLRKANFSLQQRNKFYFNYHGGWNIEKVTPTQSQLSIIIKPNQIIFKSDEINMIIQEPDTQDVHNRGHG